MLSHPMQCVFVHIPKTAGQSIEQVLLQQHGLSWKDRAVLLLRPNTEPTKGPPRLAHLQARQYVGCGYMTPEQFGQYFRFTVVRDPWDRMVSFYHYLGYAKMCEFNQFIRHIFAPYLRPMLPWFIGPQANFIYDDRDNLMVDQMMHFESLQSGFDLVCARLGMPPTPLPKVNSRDSKRGQTPANEIIAILRQIPLPRPLAAPVHHSCYRDYYDDNSRKLVSDYYRRDIALLGYQFE